VTPPSDSASRDSLSKSFAKKVRVNAEAQFRAEVGSAAKRQTFSQKIQSIVDRWVADYHRYDNVEPSRFVVKTDTVKGRCVFSKVVFKEGNFVATYKGMHLIIMFLSYCARQQLCKQQLKRFFMKE